ncbi:MAG: tetratricopeptide repeat protein [Bryobacteraceae bacterium]
MAVLPFENLSGDPSLDWVGAALREGIILQLNAIPNLRAGMFPNVREAASARAKTLVSGYFVRRGSRLQLEVQRRPLNSGRILAWRRFQAPADPEGVLPLCAELARWLDPAAAPLETGSPAALRALAEGRSSSNVAAALQAFERGAQADPGFGPLYIAWAQTLINQRQSSAALSVLRCAQGLDGRIPPRRRAEIAMLRARVEGDRAALRKALVELAALAPGDTGLQIELSREEAAAGEFRVSLQRLRRAAQADPEEPSAWNDLAYAEARLGNRAEAHAALAAYRRLAPREANPLDSLGDISYHFGDFDAAAQAYQEAFQRDPSFLGGATLYKAARAKLMMGDLPAAQQILKRYLEVRRWGGDPLVNLVQADWLYLSGDREAARRAMQSVAASGLGEVSQLALSRLALWDLASARKQEAVGLARGVLQRSQSPAARSAALLVMVIAAAPGWEGVPEGPFRSLGLACRALLEGRFEQAAQILKPMHQAADPLSQDPLAGLLAWALVEAGKIAEAAPLVAVHGTPPAGLEPPLSSWIFPRILELKARVLAAQGRRQDAQQWEAVCRRLTSGAR